MTKNTLYTLQQLQSQASTPAQSPAALELLTLPANQRSNL